MIPLPNIPLPFFAPDAPLPVSAVLSRASAASVLPHPSGVRGGQNLAFPKKIRAEFQAARPVGFLSRLIAESQALAVLKDAAEQLHDSVTHLLERAEHEEWSQRELARRAGISERTLRRIRDGQVNPLAWLPKLQPAVARLNSH